MSEPKNQGPIQTLGGDVKIKIWEGKGEYGSFPKMTFAKPYRDGDGNLQDGQSFTANDALKLQRLLPEALNEMDKWRDYFAEQKRAEPQQAPNHVEQETARPTLLDQRDLVMSNTAPETLTQGRSASRER